MNTYFLYKRVTTISPLLHYYAVPVEILYFQNKVKCSDVYLLLKVVYITSGFQEADEQSVGSH